MLGEVSAGGEKEVLAEGQAVPGHSQQGSPRSSPLLKRCPEFTRERCEGSQRATLLSTQ